MQLPVRRTNRENNGWNDFSIVPSFLDDAFGNLSPFGHMQRMLNNRNGWMPRIDVSETDKEIRVTVNAPGADPNQISISVDDNVLTISGKTEQKKEEKGETFYRMERETGSFHRSIELPGGADTNSIQATAEKGVVYITVPKKPDSQRKPITIKVQDKGK
jgi:HSP20 family protein